MATGYTSPILDGKINSLREFAILCARAFGATIDMREEPLDAPIPTEFAPSPYYLRALDSARDEYSKAENMSLASAKSAAEKEHREALARFDEQVAKRQQVLNRYNKMLEQVHAWAPPTEEHVGLKEFMISQLKESISHDCHPVSPPSPQQTAEEWLESHIEFARDNLARASKAYAEEVNRTSSRTEWVTKLRESL